MQLRLLGLERLGKNVGDLSQLDLGGVAQFHGVKKKRPRHAQGKLGSMNERGHYGTKIGKEPSTSATPWGWVISGLALSWGVILFGRYAAREMKEDEREQRRWRVRQKFLDLPDREAAALAKEIGLRSGMSQAAQDRALDAYLAKKGPR